MLVPFPFPPSPAASGADCTKRQLAGWLLELEPVEDTVLVGVEGEGGVRRQGGGGVAKDTYNRGWDRLEGGLCDRGWVWGWDGSDVV